MTYEQFENLLGNYKEGQDMLSELYDLGFDFAEGKYKLIDNWHGMLVSCLGCVYNEEGVDWVDWFVFETNWQQKDGYEAYDKDNNKIAQDLKGLWELLEQDYKLKS